MPWRLAREEVVELVSLKGRGKPEREGVRVRRLTADGLEPWWVDAIVTAADNYSGRQIPGPLASIDELREQVERWVGRSGASALRAALPQIREGVESPRESDMRLLIVGAGMPEPEVQVEVFDPRTGLLLGRADLARREQRVIEEYEGDGHRAKGQWDRDIQKYRDFERIGLLVVRATNRDFVPSPDRWLGDLAATLERRSP